jgi:serine/threonine protein kinase
MRELKTGDKISLSDGEASAEIVKELGRGGQGIVYSVQIAGKPYALKWYTCKFNDKNAFRKNMQTNISTKAPDDKFLWPLYLTEEQWGSFGYVMELRPKTFSEFSDILNNEIKFPSTALVIKSALNIVNGFRALHRKGLSYQDLNDGNFFIDVNTGNVLICDNDNVTPDGKKNPGNIGGKPGYMAPEIVRGEVHPNSLTDCHSLAVILFKLLCRHDPLMGEAYVKSVCITEEIEIKLYGKNPVFIFDPRDKSNRPLSGVHPNPIKLWPKYPVFIQEAFIKSFVEGMKAPDLRLPENEWQKVLVRFRDELLVCPLCGSELMLNLFSKGHQIKFSCGHSFSYPYCLAIGRYNVPLFPGSRLYACHTVDANDDYNTVTGEIIVNKNNPSLWGIKNMSKDSWFMMPAEGEEKSIEPGSIVPITSNMSIKFKDIDGKIVKE